LHFSSKKPRNFSSVIFSINAKHFSRLSFLVENKKLLWRPDEGNWQARKICNYLTWSKLHFRGRNAPFQARGMKSFLPSAVFKVRAEPN